VTSPDRAQPGMSRADRREVRAGDLERELVFRLETLLKAIERFFNPANHATRSDAPARNHSFAGELHIVERQFVRAFQYTSRILNDDEVNSLVFQHYLEAEWLSDTSRDMLLREHVAQSSPRESLLVLQDGLQSLDYLCHGLLAAERVDYLSFIALGRQYRTLIAGNRYFSPWAHERLSLLRCPVSDGLIRQAARATSSVRLRRAMVLTVGLLGRYLDILSWLNPASTSKAELLDALPYFALLKSECRVLQYFLEHGFSQRAFQGGTLCSEEEEFRSRVDSLAFELGVDLKRVCDEVLIDCVAQKSVGRLRGQIEAAHGMLKSFLQQAVASLLAFGIPDLSLESVFPDVVIRKIEASRLRQDLWMFEQVLDHVSSAVADPCVPPPSRRAAAQGMLSFLDYFEMLGFELVRWNDRDAFRHFFAELRQLRYEPFTEPARCADISANLECFRIFIETVRILVSQRILLREVPLDTTPLQRALAQFVGANPAAR
jgi:hypothetical protein